MNVWLPVEFFLMNVKNSHSSVADYTFSLLVESRPKFDHSSRLFELDSCGGFGKVCLVYKDTKPGTCLCVYGT